MIDFLIFSKNRACQLDFLLRSIDNYCLFNYKIHIIYKYDEDHKESYEILKKDREKIELNKIKSSFILQENFAEDTKKILKNTKKVCLLTDDTVFFKYCRHTTIKENETFSFRLGYNTIIQTLDGYLQPPLIPDVLDIPYICWNPHKYGNNYNYGYPFSIDGHIYHSKFLYNIIKDKQFNSTNDLEGILCQYKNLVKLIKSNSISSCVNIPTNNISGLTSVGSNTISLNDLKNKFVNNQRISFKTFKDKLILGCHQDILLEFYSLI